MSGAVSTTAPAPKPPTATELVKAEAEVDAACMQSPALRFAAMLADIEASFEEVTALEACGTENTRAIDAESKISDAARKCFLDEVSPETIGHALQAIVDAELESERIRRLYEALRSRAEKREARLRRVLWPIVEQWCVEHPPAKGSTWKFPTTLAKIVAKSHSGKLEVAHLGKAVEAIKAALGQNAYDVLSVSTSILVGAAKDALTAAGVDPSTLQGVKWIPPGKRMEVHGG